MKINNLIYPAPSPPSYNKEQGGLIYIPRAFHLKEQEYQKKRKKEYLQSQKNIESLPGDLSARNNNEPETLLNPVMHKTNIPALYLPSTQ